MEPVNTTLAANIIHGKRINLRSQRNYQGKINTIKVFLLSRPDEYSHLIQEDGTILVPLSSECVKDLFGWLSINTDLPKKNRRSQLTEAGDESDSANEEDVGEDVDVFAVNKVTMSHACMQGYKSALGWYYAEHGCRLDSLLDDWLDNFIKGYKKTVAEKKEKGIMKISEGKSSLSFGGYKHICDFMLSMKPIHRAFSWQEGLFSWLYMTLTWNLMCRSYNSAHLMLQHLDWKDDCMTIKFAKTKNDSTGEGLGNEKHIYANPLIPSICPILSLAVYVWSTPRSIDNNKLFCGESQEARFSKILNKVLHTITPTVNLGATIEDLGCHSNRKGSTSYALNIHWISAVQVYLRAGWSLGHVQDRYIFAGAGGDQIVGRAVAGLPCNSQDFCLLPPHLSPDQESLCELVGWSNIISGFNSFPPCFRRVVPYLFASLCYHHEWLKSHLSVEHPLWKQPVFTRTMAPGTGENLVLYLSSKVIVCRNYCELTGIQASGIPSHLLIASEISSLKQDVSTLRDFLETKTEYLIECVQGKISSLNHSIVDVPEQVKTILLKNFVLEGVVPLSYADIERMVTNAIEKLNQRLDNRLDNVCLELRTQIQNGSQTSGQSQAPSSLQSNDGSGTQSPYTTFCWGGKLGRLVPENFQFPKTNAKTMWNLWLYGDKSRKIHP